MGSHEARSQCIVHHANLAVRRSALTLRAYGQGVADLYMQRTPLHARTLDFHASADPYADEKANAQIVSRMLDGKVRMPVDAEEALVLALPEPYRRNCLMELARRTGHLAADLPGASAATHLQHAGGLLSAAGDAVQALAPMLADGVLDPEDRPHAEQAKAQLQRLMAHCATQYEAINRLVLGFGPAASKHPEGSA